MTKADILDAAAQIIREKGFHGTSMQDIAQAVDLRKASLYHHVTSKQEILVELLDNALDMLNERMEAVVSQDIPPEEKFQEAMRAYLNTMAENLSLSGVLLMEHRSLEPKYRKRHIPRRDRHEALWQSILEEGIQQGVFACEDVHLAVKGVLGVANWTVMWFDPKGAKSATEIADQSSKLLLYGFSKR